MSERLRKNLLKYGIGGAVCLAVSLSRYFSQCTESTGLADRYRILSDGFSLPGLLLLFSGLMLWLSNEGAFHGIGYVLRYAVQSLMFLGRRGHVETYGEYVENHSKKPVNGFAFLFVLAAACLLISGIFVALYYKAMG